MAAYFVANLTITNLEGFQEYGAQVPPIIAHFGGRYLVRGGEVTPVEGNWDLTRVVILEFDTMEALKTWYHSPEYQAILPLRLNNSTGSAVMIEGIAPPV